MNDFTILNFELSCLCLKKLERLDLELFCKQRDITAVTQVLLNHLLELKFDECLKNCLNVENIFDSISFLTSFPSKFNESGLLDKFERKLWLFSCGVSCLQLFVQANWTGPCVTEFCSISKVLALDAKEHLSEEGQDVYHLVQFPHYLLAAKVAFSSLCEESLFQTSSWWLFRCHCLHSQLLSQRSESLLSKTKQALQHAAVSLFLKEDEYRSLLFQLRLEAGLALLHYYNYKEADSELEAARDLCELEFGFTGALGVRTKFQQKAVSQLQVLVKRSTTVPKMKSLISTKSCKTLPKNLLLNDDTLLEKVKLIDEDDLKNPELNPEEYCMILAACTAMQKTNPSHRIKQEQLQAVIEFLLDSPSCWCVHAEALRLRCLNEKDRSRTVERSMMQLDNLVSLVTSKQPSHSTRLDLFYATRPPPVWILQKDLAKLYLSLGAVSSAYQIYEKLEMWEDAVLCLIRSDRTSEALNTIHEQLKTRETANLWCLLGDIMQEPKHYLKAWEFSKHRSARAMTSLGCYYVSKKEYRKAVDCFEKSLSVLSLQRNTWFTMGCALLQLEEYEKAADAFRRCVGLDWDNYEAWTNLSASYVRCGKKDQAFKALSEAIKCNFDKWQLWENYLAICCDVGQFHEAISAYSRLLELKHKYVDVPVLKILVRVVNEDIDDANGSPGSLLKPKLLSLFGHVTSQTTGNFQLWELYANLCGNGASDIATENEKSIQFLHKAMRTVMQTAGWEKSETNIEKLNILTNNIQNACSHSRSQLSPPVLSSIRLTVNGLIGKLKQREKLLLDEKAQKNMRNTINDVEKHFQLLNEILIEIKQS